MKEIYISSCVKCSYPTKLNERYCRDCLRSVKQSNKIIRGIQRAKEKNEYSGGRPRRNDYDIDYILALYLGGFSMREISEKHSIRFSPISHTHVKRLVMQEMPDGLEQSCREATRSKIAIYRQEIRNESINHI